MSKFDLAELNKLTFAEDSEIIAFAKPSEVERSDVGNGIARFGGVWRNPSYVDAYLKAARILIGEAKAAKELDQLGLPIFYLQRHALELSIKSLLRWLYEVVEMRSEQQPEDELRSISKKQLERLSGSHSLVCLNEDLKKTCVSLGCEFDATDLEKLINQIERYEKTSTWSRYPTSNSEESHLSEEVAIPLVDIHEKLERVIKILDSDMCEGEPPLQQIRQEWNNRMTIKYG